MKIEVIVPVYNEADFIPFLFQHYKWVDKITVLFAMNSTDESLFILKQCQKLRKKFFNPEIEIKDSTEPEGINDMDRIRNINGAYIVSDADWVIHADADEFILIDREYIESIPEQYNLINPIVFQAYPHVTDKPLDITIPVNKQRRHGAIVNMGRPVILRTKQDLTLEIGKHSIIGDIREYPHKPMLIHWQMADKQICINRRVNNRNPRMSLLNKEKKWGWHEQVDNLEENLLKEFKDHENDLIVL